MNGEDRGARSSPAEASRETEGQVAFGHDLQGFVLLNTAALAWPGPGKHGGLWDAARSGTKFQEGR